MIIKGKIYKKQTESWYGNDPKGTEVVVTKIEGNFIKFRNVKRFLWFNIKSGKTQVLNNWSFRRIYITNDP